MQNYRDGILKKPISVITTEEGIRILGLPDLINQTLQPNLNVLCEEGFLRWEHSLDDTRIYFITTAGLEAIDDTDFYK